MTSDNIHILHSEGWSCSNEGEVSEENVPVMINGKRHWRTEKLLKVAGLYNTSSEMKEMHSVKALVKYDDGTKRCYEGTVKVISYDIAHIRIEREIEINDTLNKLRRIKHGNA